MYICYTFCLLKETDLSFCRNLSFDVSGILPQRQNPNTAAIRRFFADLSKESVAKQITIGGVTGWCVYSGCYIVFSYVLHAVL